MSEKKSGASGRARGGDAGPEQGFDRWLNRQLHHLYDPVLAEAVPDEIMRLLHQFDNPSSLPEPPADPPAQPGKPDRN